MIGPFSVTDWFDTCDTRLPFITISPDKICALLPVLKPGLELSKTGAAFPLFTIAM